MNIDKYQKKNDIPTSEIIALLSEEYKGFTKVQLSMARNTEKTGLTLCPKAAKIIKAKYTPAKPTAPQKKRVSVTLTDEQHKSLLALQKIYGYKSLQDLCLAVLMERVERVNEVIGE